MLEIIGESGYRGSCMRKPNMKTDQKTERETRFPMSTNLKRKLAAFIIFQAGQERRSQAGMLEILAEAGAMLLYKDQIMKWLKEQEERASGEPKKGPSGRGTLPLWAISHGTHHRAIREGTD